MNVDDDLCDAVVGEEEERVFDHGPSPDGDQRLGKPLGHGPEPLPMAGGEDHCLHEISPTARSWGASLPTPAVEEPSGNALSAAADGLVLNPNLSTPTSAASLALPSVSPLPRDLPVLV